MNMEAVRGFVAVAEERQFQLAAAHLGISQQAVSKRIASLEADLGTVLFKRTATGATLTRDGQTFLPHAKAILTAVSEAFDSVQPQTRPLRVDVLSRRIAAAELLRAFQHENPTLPIEMVTSSGAGATIQSLLTGEIDAGYVYLRGPMSELDARLNRSYAYLEPLQVIVGEQHPLAGSPSARPAELAHFRAWVPGIVSGSEWEAFYQELAEVFTIDIDSTGTESLLDIIADSRSLLTFVGEKSRVAWPGHLGLVRIPVVAPTPLYPWSLSWHSGT
jgi:DNA-binding transcriptional LysR family regulator